MSLELCHGLNHCRDRRPGLTGTVTVPVTELSTVCPLESLKARDGGFHRGCLARSLLEKIVCCNRTARTQ